MSKKIKIAIVGVGNCCSALVQGFEYYKKFKNEIIKQESIPGLLFPKIGDYKLQDIEIVAAFDVDSRKVGLPLGSAVFKKPNCCRVFIDPESIKNKGPIVQKAPVLDGVAPHMRTNPDPMYRFDVDDKQVPVSMDEALAKVKPDILINYLPVGSQQATENLAEVCLRQKISFLNCIPVFIASDPIWENKFIKEGIPIIGDDMRSQFQPKFFSQMIYRLKCFFTYFFWSPRIKSYITIFLHLKPAHDL